MVARLGDHAAHHAQELGRRAAVEGVFATLKRWMSLTCVRYRGLARNGSHWMLAALAYNMNRSLNLA